MTELPARCGATVTGAALGGWKRIESFMSNGGAPRSAMAPRLPDGRRTTGPSRSARESDGLRTHASPSSYDGSCAREIPMPFSHELKKLLAPFDVASLDVESATVYGVTEDLRLAYTNPAWHTFARANGARCNDKSMNVGSPIMDVTPAPLRPAYQRLFDRARATRVVAEHDYECSSATLFRSFRMDVHPCDSGAFVVVNILLRTSEHAEPSMNAVDANYRTADGLIVQCSHCRRVRREGSPSSWDWVRRYVASPPDGISHGICGVCLDSHYPPEM